MVGATILYRGTSWMVKPEGLLGWWVYTWMSWPPLAFTQQSVLDWAMAHLPSWIVMGSVARSANFPPHIPALVSRNVASLASSAVKPSPIEHLP